MKKILLAGLCALGMPALAQGFGISIGNDDFSITLGADIDGVNGGFHFEPGDDGFVEFHNGNLYVPTHRACNLESVYIGVAKDDVEIQDFDVVFGNGETQDIPLRQHFARGSYSAAKDLRGGKRCIVGFSLEAFSRMDWDRNSAFVTLYGRQLQRDRRGWYYQDVVLGSVKIKDYMARRDWHRHNGWRDRGGWRRGGWERGDLRPRPRPGDRNDDRRDRRDDVGRICKNPPCKGRFGDLKPPRP